MNFSNPILERLRRAAASRDATERSAAAARVEAARDRALAADALWDEAVGRLSSDGRERCRPLALRPDARYTALPAKARAPGRVPAAVRAAVRQLVRGEAPWPLYLHGPTGTGKTCAALAVLDHLIGTGYYYTATVMAETLLKRGAELWPALQRADLVVCDELETGADDGGRSWFPPYRRSCVRRLLDEREGRPLIAMSNLDLAALDARCDDCGATASRLAAGLVVRVDGPDRRAATALAWHQAQITAHYEGRKLLAPDVLELHVRTVEKGRNA